ncbi:MaoC/PaaZ C-terminal domain-containing protein [Sinorhizobium mexicanum]|uniref:Protein dehydratase n=1 Tax=Sinorhizobium mexicanum TaxID=375549 RepID=A0A859QI29_9HYPH|nr:MaoC/PaaZ C-terminal domain-containing protein [Sinorhizobium mexicanum]MBP1881785.1 acyl dehydratase [Sinorhizobium mexicanum]QLL61540.1 protein dehydratase [Sinorhizobium mexicanum]
MKTGETFKTETLEVSSKDIIDFAALWDPQPFHLSAEAGKGTQFGGLIGSGLQSLCSMVKLGVESGFLTKNGIAGLSVENLRFRAPLRPEMVVYAEFEVKNARPSSKDPQRIIATLAATLKDVAGPTIITADLVNLYHNTEGV